MLAFPEIPDAPGYWLCRIGLPYPTETTNGGDSVGADRECRFSGCAVFKEKVAEFVPERLLTFDIVEMPPDPELLGHLDAHRGQFELRDNGDGTYTVRFFRNGSPVYVTVNQELPVSSAGNSIYAGWGGFVNTYAGSELWVALAEVVNLVAEVPDVKHCAVFVEPAGQTAGAGRLVAYLVATRSDVTPELVHDQVCSRLDGRTDVTCVPYPEWINAWNELRA